MGYGSSGSVDQFGCGRPGPLSVLHGVGDEQRDERQRSAAIHSEQCGRQPGGHDDLRVGAASPAFQSGQPAENSGVSGRVKSNATRPVGCDYSSNAGVTPYHGTNAHRWNQLLRNT